MPLQYFDKDKTNSDYIDSTKPQRETIPFPSVNLAFGLDIKKVSQLCHVKMASKTPTNTTDNATDTGNNTHDNSAVERIATLASHVKTASETVERGLTAQPTLGASDVFHGLFSNPPHVARHGGDLVADVLEAHGVKFIFTLVGGHISPLLVSSKERGIRIIDVRHEVSKINDVSLPAAGAEQCWKNLLVVMFCGVAFVCLVCFVRNLHISCRL